MSWSKILSILFITRLQNLISTDSKCESSVIVHWLGTNSPDFASYISGNSYQEETRSGSPVTAWALIPATLRACVTRESASLFFAALSFYLGGKKRVQTRCTLNYFFNSNILWFLELFMYNYWDLIVPYKFWGVRCVSLACICVCACGKTIKVGNECY